MRIKTFVATYLLFLTLLFSSISIVSFYLNNSQINMLQNKSIAQFQTIVSSLDRDIAVLWNKYPSHNPFDTVFYEAIDELVRGYTRYYSRHNINISLIDTRLSAYAPPTQDVSFKSINDNYFIFIIGSLTEPFGYFLLDYSLNVTENIVEMRAIQNTLLFSAIVFSIIAAFGLYLILSSIFRPLTVVAKASQKIANGQFGERIPIKSKNELAQVAVDFNKMAAQIERQIILLEEEAKNKQQFIDNFAHEMRTPLTSIYGYAEYMQKALLEDGEVVQLSKRIMNRTRYLQDIASSLLQLAMLRNYTPIIKEISLQNLFDDISHIIEPIAKNSNIKFLHTANTPILKGQEDLIKSLMLNLCLNAITACNSKECDHNICESIYKFGFKPIQGSDDNLCKQHTKDKTVHMEAKNKDNSIILSVTDNGCGIPADSLNKVTEPFYRLDSARNPKDGGAGLGLALCQQIAKVHGAKMTVQSTVGVETTIKIIFTTS